MNGKVLELQGCNRGVIVDTSRRIWWGWLSARFDFVMIRSSDGISGRSNLDVVIDKAKRCFASNKVFYMHTVDNHQASMQVSTVIANRLSDSPVILDITSAGSDTVTQMISGLAQRNVPVIIYVHTMLAESTADKFKLPIIIRDLTSITPNVNASVWSWWAYRKRIVPFRSVIGVVINPEKK